MRFCTSELKSAPIASALVKRFPGRQIVSACGVRREEGNGKTSSPRTNAPTSAPNKRLVNKRTRTSGRDWNPIAAWTAADVFAFCAARGFVMHEGYELGMSRISCRFCIMQDIADQRVSASVLANAPVFCTIARLEIRSTFSFQGAYWLGDVAPHLLSEQEREALRASKDRARRRTEIEGRIPKHLLYTVGWPTVMPTWDEAVLLAEVRRDIGALLEIDVHYTEPQDIIDRFSELMAQNAARQAKKSRRLSRARARSGVEALQAGGAP